MSLKGVTKIKDFYMRLERYLSPVALLTGFIIDNLTLRRIDLWAENLVIMVYLGIAGASILLLNAHEAEKLKGKLFDWLARVLPFALQFSLGGLFSVFVVFYSRSASIIRSWPFLLFLILMLIGNELFRKRYLKFTFRLSIYFIALFSYAVFSVPILRGKIGPGSFLLGGLISLLVLVFVILALYRINPGRLLKARNSLIVSIGIIYFGFNLLYFTNIIPPIPLALMDNGIYHSVRRVGSNYAVEVEPAPWYKFFDDFNHTFKWQIGRPVYCYSAIFAPTNITTKVYHRWQYYDPSKEEWQEATLVSYNMKGGRDGGYRGFSYVYNVWAGKWRVDVITEQGQVLGRTKFKIVKAAGAVELSVEER